VFLKRKASFSSEGVVNFSRSAVIKREENLSVSTKAVLKKTPETDHFSNPVGLTVGLLPTSANSDFLLSFSVETCSSVQKNEEIWTFQTIGYVKKWSV
jgi:hypothetical protein